MVEKEGSTPTFYIRALVEMEDFISQVKQDCNPVDDVLSIFLFQLWEDKEAKAKLSKINARVSIP